MSYTRSPYRQQAASYKGSQSARGQKQPQYGSRSRSPFQAPAVEPQTFVFAELPEDEKSRFMDFLLSNEVDFQYDHSDSTYVATIKIVNKQEDQPQVVEFEQEIVSGMDQMRQFQNNSRGGGPQQNPGQDTVMMLQNQIQDLTKFQNRLKQFDENPKGRKQASRNGAQSARGGVRTEPTYGSVASSSGPMTARDRPTTGKKTPGPSTRKAVNTTSAAQLQVYLKPEFKNFTEILNPRNPQTIRPKRQNLLALLRTIEDIYSHRFAVKKESTTLHESIVDWLKLKYKQKSMIDQTGFDLLASTEQHRQTSAEVNLFYSFLTQTYPLKDLLYYLYVRSLAEKELAILITKLPSNQDIRSVMITNKKCFKIARMYFDNVLAVEQNMDQMNDNAPEIAAENFVDICIQDARLEDLFDETKNKLQLSFFLMKLLNEFKHQEVSNAVENQRQEQSYQPSPDGYGSPLRNMEDMQLEPLSGGARRNNNAPAMDDMDPTEQREAELLNKIMRFIISNKVNSMISFMLTSYQEGLSKEVLDMIREEIKGALEGKIQMLLQSVFMSDQAQWFSLLGVDQPNAEQMALFQQLGNVIEQVFENATYNEGNPDESVVVDDANLEELARVLLSCKELRAEFANMVSSLTSQAHKGLESESSERDIQNNWQQSPDQQ